MKKIVSFLLMSLLMLPMTVKANTLQLTNDEINKNTTNINEALAESDLNKFNDSVPQEALKFLEENAVSATTNEYYIRSIETKDGDIISDPKKYTEAEYNEFVSNPSLKDFDNNKFYENKWIKLKLEAYKLSNGQYNFLMFYDWKTKPMLTFHDVIGFSYPSNISCDTQSAYSFHQQILVNPNNQYTDYITTTHNAKESDYFKSNLNGIAFKFDLPSSPDTWPSYYSGYLSVNGGFTSNSITSSTLELSYTHQQLSLPYSIQDAVDFLLNGTIKVNITGGQDEFRAADRFWRF